MSNDKPIVIAEDVVPLKQFVREGLGGTDPVAWLATVAEVLKALRGAQVESGKDFVAVSRSELCRLYDALLPYAYKTQLDDDERKEMQRHVTRLHEIL